MCVGKKSLALENVIAPALTLIREKASGIFTSSGCQTIIVCIKGESGALVFICVTSMCVHWQPTCMVVLIYRVILTPRMLLSNREVQPL